MMKLSLGVDPDVQTEFIDVADQAAEEEEEEEEEVAADGGSDDGGQVEEPTEGTVDKQEEVSEEIGVAKLYSSFVAILVHLFLVAPRLPPTASPPPPLSLPATLPLFYSLLPPIFSAVGHWRR